MPKYAVFSGPYFPVFSPNTGKYGPEKTPYLDSFYAVSHIWAVRQFYLFINWKEFTTLRMFLWLIFNVFLFLVCSHLPSNLSTVDVIQNRYGNQAAELIRKFKMLDYKCRKVLSDLDFLNNCIKNVCSKICSVLRCVIHQLTLCAKQNYWNIKCQQWEKRKATKGKFLSTRNNVMCKLTLIDFKHACNLFLLGDDKSPPKQQKIENTKIG